MKKTISILLAVIMMFSLSTAAFAKIPESSLDTEYTVTVDGSKTYYFSIPEDGVYKISASIDIGENDFGLATFTVGTADTSFSSLYLYYSSSSFIGDDFPFDATNTSDEDCFVAKKDAVIMVTVENFNEFMDIEVPAATVTFSISEAKNLPEIEIGGTYSFSGEDAYYILKPTEDGIYNINSDVSGVDISVMDSDGNIQYDFFYDEYTPDFSFVVEAGKLYCIYIDPAFDNFSFNVADASKIAITGIDLEDVYVVSGDYTWVYPAVLPYGACYNFDEFEVSVGNEKIATAEYDPEDGSIVVYGHRAGKTTLTVTEPISGVSTEVEIRVQSKISNFFSNLFLAIVFRILSFIDSIFGGAIVY